MSSGEAIDVIVAGDSPATIEFRDMSAHPKLPINLKAIASANRDLIGLNLGQTDIDYKDVHSDVRIIDLEDVADEEAPVVFSSLPDSLALTYEERFARGRLLVTTDHVSLDNPNAVLFNANIGGDKLSGLYDKEQDRASRIMAIGKSMAVIAGVALAPVERELGIDNIHLETLQGWSEVGETKVPEAHKGDVVPLNAEAQVSIETDLQEFLNQWDSNVNARKANMAPWVRGHHALVTLRAGRVTSVEEIEEIMRSARVPSERKLPKYGPFSQKRRIIEVSRDKLLLPREKGYFKLAPVKPMRASVRIKEVGETDRPKVDLELAGDNLILGSAGSAVMNIMYARKMGYLGK